MLVAALGAPLTTLALLFGPAEYFSLMVLGLVFAVVLAKGSVLKAMAMIMIGLLLSMVGSDLETGAVAHGVRHSGTVRRHRLRRRRHGRVRLCRDHAQPGDQTKSRDSIVAAKVTGLMPTWPDLKAAAGAIGARHRRSARSSASCPAAAP